MKKFKAVTDNRVTRYVDRIVQGTLLRRLVSHWLAIILLILGVFGVLSYMVTWCQNPMADRSKLWNEFIWRFAPIAGTAAVLVPFFVWDTIKTTHRIVGPMVRVRREFKNLAEGRRANRLKFRPDDYWRDVADEFNAYCDYVEPHVCTE